MLYRFDVDNMRRLLLPIPYNVMSCNCLHHVKVVPQLSQNQSLIHQHILCSAYIPGGMSINHVDHFLPNTNATHGLALYS